MSPLAQAMAGLANNGPGPATCKGTALSTSSHRGFTLVELLVVVGIVTLLLTVLLPALGAARERANEIQCASNMRQVAHALILYATNNRGLFPPNLNSPARFWYDSDRIGQYIKDVGPPTLAGVKGGVMVCPADEDSWRSYSMNLWTSCQIPPNFLAANPPLGRPWAVKSGKSSVTMLLIERWASIGSVPQGGYVAPPYAGAAGQTPGQRFGGGTGITPMVNAGPRFGWVNTELTYYRHRRKRGRLTEPVGRINIAYVDGHVASKTNDDLVDRLTGLSTLDSWWSPLDPDINH